MKSSDRDEESTKHSFSQTDFSQGDNSFSADWT